MPVIPESIGIKGAVFADIGTLYGAPFTDGDLAGTELSWRSSVGASLIWASPFGPLRVDYSVPVLKEEGDKIKACSSGTPPLRPFV